MSQNSWKKCNKCMCNVSEKNIHWCWRYSSGRTEFLNILSIWANKNGDKSAIVNLILTKLHRFHGRMVVNACVEYREEMFIIVGDIHPDRHIFKYFLNLSKQNSNKSAILNLIMTKLHRIYGRIVINVCVKYRNKIFISVGDIHQDRQHFQIFCQFEQTKIITPAGLCFSTYKYSFSISTLAHTVTMAADYTCSCTGVLSSTLQAPLMPCTQFNRRGKMRGQRNKNKYIANAMVSPTG